MRGGDRRSSLGELPVREKRVAISPVPHHTLPHTNHIGMARVAPKHKTLPIWKPVDVHFDSSIF